MRITPRDLALLIDRFQILFVRPSAISGRRGLAATITSGAFPIDVLKGIVELTRGLGPPLPQHTSGLPYIQEKRRD